MALNINTNSSFLGVDMFGQNDSYLDNEGDFFIHDYALLDQSLQEMQTDIFLEINPLTISIIIMYSIVFIVGLLGNGFVILVIIKFRHMRTLTNVFLVNLTVGDLTVIILCIPVTLGITVYKKWIYGEVMCKLTSFVQGSAVGVSVLSLLSISISRYFAIYKPLTAKIIFSRKNIRYMLAGIWLLAFASLSPLLYVNSVTTFGVPGILEFKICQEKWESMSAKHIYNVFIFGVLFALPFLFMAGAYIVIAFTLWHGNAILYGSSHTGVTKKSSIILKKRRRTVKMLICVVTIFGVCWLPYYIINIWMDFHAMEYPPSKSMETLSNYVYPLVLLLGLANSAVNPICYFFLSNGFRRAFKQLFRIRIRRKSGTGASFWRGYRSSASESIETAEI